MNIQDTDMQTKVIYIAGPMTRKPDFNRTAFSLAAVRLSAQGAIPLNPAMLPDGLSEADYMRIGLAMLQCADGIYLLYGWQDSAGGHERATRCLILSILPANGRRCSVSARLLKQDGVTVRCRSLAAATIVKRKPSAIFAARNAGKIGKNTSMPSVSGP